MKRMENNIKIIWALHESGKTNNAVSEMTGTSLSTVQRITQLGEAAKNKNDNEVIGMLNRKLVSQSMLDWLEHEFKWTVWEPKEEKKPESAPPVQAPDQTGAAMMRVLSLLTAQNEILKQINEGIKTYGPAIISAVQTTKGPHKTEAIEAAISDGVARLAADLKDNQNANADIPRKELSDIKNNTRKRGL